MALHQSATPNTKFIRCLKDRLLVLVVAVCTKQMIWFGALCLWLQSVSKRFDPGVCQFVTLLLSVPCFQLSHFFFKLTYRCNQIRVVLLRGQNNPLQFDDLRLDGCGLFQIYHRLSDVVRCLERR